MSEVRWCGFPPSSWLSLVDKNMEVLFLLDISLAFLITLKALSDFLNPNLSLAACTSGKQATSSMLTQLLELIGFFLYRKTREHSETT